MNLARTITPILLAMGLLLSCTSCNLPDRESDYISNLKVSDSVKELLQDFENTKFESVEDIQRVLANAVTCERAIVFVDVKWSATARMGLFKFAELAIAYNELHSSAPVMFHYTDATEGNYVPYEVLPGAHEALPYGRRSLHVGLIQGNGELFWLKQGQVIHVEPILNFNFVSDLVDKTHQIMSSDIAPTD